MPRIDLKRERKDLYAPKPGDFVEVVVPPMTFLAVDGHGDPNLCEEHRLAIEALFVASYAAKFLSKRELGRDYPVLPLEGLWWAADMSVFRARDKASWSWRLLIRQPDWLTAEMLDEAVRAAHGKGAGAASLVRRQVLDEGRCVQTLHVGSYDDEGPTLARLHDEWLPSRSLRPAGRHHEIYLSDRRRTQPEKLRTILRQPVAGIDRAEG